MKEKYIDANWHYPAKGEYPVAFGEYKNKVYPQIPCLVFHRGRYGVRFWNCIEECWDEEDGDDFFCSKDSVEEWMYIDALEQEQPNADLEAEVERWWNERYAKLKKDYKFDSMSGHYLDNKTIIDLARHFAEWGAEHLKR